MTVTRIVGDIHGRLRDYKQMIKGCEQSIQIGDFGVGFFSREWQDGIYNFQAACPQHRFFTGNHDDPELAATMPGHMVRGFHEDLNAFVVPGAWSIDWAGRIEGVSWWRNEELSISELNDLIDQYEQVKPRVMLTHDAPIEVTNEMFIKTGLALGGRKAKQTPNRTNAALQAMFEIHQPEFWFFGHWHVPMQYVERGTMFHCVNQYDFVDFDFEKGDYA